jgi:hypothetical protein
VSGPFVDSANCECPDGEGAGTPSDASPQPIGTAAAGTSDDYSRADHVHALAAHVLTSQAESSLASEVNLGALTTGLLKISVSGGVATPSTAVADTDFADPATTAPKAAKYVTAQAESGLSAEVNLGALTTGILKHTVAGGVSTPATAVAGTDFAAPDAKFWTSQAESGLSAEVNLGALTTGLLKHSVSGSVSTPATAVAGTDYVAPFGPHQTYREIGLALLGISRANAWEIFENFMAMPGTSAPPAAWQAVSSSGSSSASNQVSGTQALSRIASGSSASGQRDQATQVYMGHQGTNAWYYAARFKINASPDSQAKIVQAVTTPGGNTVGIGFMGPISTTNFVAYRDGTLTSGTSLGNLAAVDTSYHVFEMWCAGDGVLKARIDGGSTLTGSQSSAATDMYVYHTVRNGTTAADRQMDRNWVYWLVGVT